VLHRVAVALSQSLAFSDVMDALARELVHAVDRVSECSIAVWHPARDVLEIASVHVRETGTSEEDRGDIYLLDDYPASRVLLRAADGFGVQRVTDPGISPFILERLVEWGWRTWIELPLVVDGRSVGLIEMADYNSARRWAQRDVDFCRTIAAQAALAVRNAQLYEDLRSQVDKDPLTGVLNHRAFYERLEQELARAVRSETHVAVLVVDLDDFKALNDTRGHVAGDRALRRVARAIRSTCRAVDIPGRLGGDEFAVILPDIEPDLDALAGRLLDAIATQTGLHASLGVAVARDPADRAARTVARADGSLLEAKAAGKHTYRVAA
jgi:diguanylate cyclase (GGDEF)-like protein